MPRAADKNPESVDIAAVAKARSGSGLRQVSLTNTVTRSEAFEL